MLKTLSLSLPAAPKPAKSVEVGLDPHLAALYAIALGLEPEQGFLAVLAPIPYVGLKRGTVGETFKNVPGL